MTELEAELRELGRAPLRPRLPIDELKVRADKLSRLRKRAVTTLVAVAVVVVFLVPLPQLHIVNYGGATPGTARSGSQPAVDLAATPKGWVPVDYGDAQVSVPAKWKVAYRSPACGSAIAPGELFVNPVPSTMSCVEIVQNQVQVRPLVTSEVWRSLPQRAVNSVAVYGSASGKAGPYYAPSLGVEIDIQGPLGKRVLDTLTWSPRAVAQTALILARAQTPVPASWRSESFDGISFSVPNTWRTVHTSHVVPIGGSCAPEGVALPDSGVLLSTDRFPALVGCPVRPLDSYGRPEVPTNGVQIDGGPRAPTVTTSSNCVGPRGLWVCMATDQYSILVLKVSVDNRVQPVIVSVGLAGSGTVARTILDSLRPSTAEVPPQLPESDGLVNARGLFEVSNYSILLCQGPRKAQATCNARTPGLTGSLGQWWISSAAVAHYGGEEAVPLPVPLKYARTISSPVEVDVSVYRFNNSSSPELLYQNEGYVESPQATVLSVPGVKGGRVIKIDSASNGGLSEYQFQWADSTDWVAVSLLGANMTESQAASVASDVHA
ncbi:MAG: hypothetical protein ABSG36_14420 [Acidimicrobiales bacterium]